MKKKWFGILIKNEITIESVKIIIGEREIIVILIPGSEQFDKEKFFLILKYIEKKNKGIREVFGIFFSDFYEMIRKKIKKDIFYGIDEEKFMFLLDGGNIDAYYENKKKTEGFWGIEIRYEEEINQKNWENGWYEIKKFLITEKNK